VNEAIHIAASKGDPECPLVSEGSSMLVMIGFTLIGVILVIGLNVRLLRRKLPAWRSDLIPGFIVTIGNGRAGLPRIALWTGVGFSEAEARIIVHHQMMCILEMPIGFFVGGLVLYLVR
jgi:hypothetical protein